MKFLKNAWYMAAWSSEVQDRLLARTLLEIPLVLFRTDDGEVAALQDRCPHRFAPLSMGKRQGKTIQCAYHGLTFNGSGTCVLNPSGDGQIPPRAKVRSFPVVERYRMIWIWMGDPALADDTKIPDYSTVPEEGVGSQNLDNYLHVKSNYLIEIDNLMDLSHVNFLHEGSLGNETMRPGKVTVVKEEQAVRAELWLPDTVCSYGRMAGDKCDQWLNMIWMAPASMILEFGSVPVGADPVQDPKEIAYHIITPETQRTTHYFFGSAGSYEGEDSWQAQAFREAQVRAFETEDNPMIEAVDRQMDGEDLWALNPVLLSSDAAAVEVRRRLERMIKKEAD